MSHIDADFHMAVVVQILLYPLAISVPGLHWYLFFFVVVLLFLFGGLVFFFFLISSMASAVSTFTVSTTDILFVEMCWFLPNLLIFWQDLCGRLFGEGTGARDSFLYDRLKSIISKGHVQKNWGIAYLFLLVFQVNIGKHTWICYTGKSGLERGRGKVS